MYNVEEKAEHFINFFGDNTLTVIEKSRNGGNHFNEELFEAVEQILKNKTMNRTLEEIVKTPELTDGTEVTFRVVDNTFNGKIVGKSSDGLMPYYIVECTDGSFPNEMYKYKFLSLPLSEIFVK